MKRFYRQFVFNIVLCLIIFAISLSILPQGFLPALRQYGTLGFYFYTFHIFISLVFSKYETVKRYEGLQALKLYLRSWIYTSGLSLLLIYTLQQMHLPRKLVLFNIFGLFIAESLAVLFRIAYQSAVQMPDEKEKEAAIPEVIIPETEYSDEKRHILEISDSILEDIGEDALFFIAQFIDSEPGKALILHTTNRFNILNQPKGDFRKVVNLHRLNDVRYVNKFLEAINSRIPVNGLMAVCAETKNQRKARILAKYPPLLNYGYYAIDFMYKRVLPKLPIGKKLYFSLTHGNNRVMSRPEILGRICSCGFSIVQEQKIGRAYYVIARKTGEPFYPKHATYGPFIYLNRVGKNGKLIKVYKIRTMHPYSEYLQSYIHSTQGLNEGGKFMDDYRVTSLGRFMRKLWLDELPMFINVMKGEMKIVGVRPLSQHYFGLYSPEVQQLRIKYKPGLIPPYYADMPKTLEEIEESERKYLEAYGKSPFLTDVRYFFKATTNIVFKRARSN